MPDVSEGFEFQRVARWIAQEHGRLFARLAFEAHSWFNYKLRPGSLQSIGQFAPNLHRQNQAEMRHGYILSVDVVAGRVTGMGAFVGDDLVSVEIEIDPFCAAAPFATAKQIAIEFPRCGKVVHRKGQMKWGAVNA